MDRGENGGKKTLKSFLLLFMELANNLAPHIKRYGSNLECIKCGGSLSYSAKLYNPSWVFESYEAIKSKSLSVQKLQIQQSQNVKSTQKLLNKLSIFPSKYLQAMKTNPLSSVTFFKPITKSQRSKFFLFPTPLPRSSLYLLSIRTSKC